MVTTHLDVMNDTYLKGHHYDNVTVGDQDAQVRQRGVFEVSCEDLSQLSVTGQVKFAGEKRRKVAQTEARSATASDTIKTLTCVRRRRFVAIR